MSDYKESNISGKQWQRCNRIVINNDYQQQPGIQMFEETITNIGVQQIQQPAGGGLYVPFKIDGVIELRDTTTGELTGVSISHADLHQILWSMYMNEAVKRDSYL